MVGPRGGVSCCPNSKYVQSDDAIGAKPGCGGVDQLTGSKQIQWGDCIRGETTDSGRYV